MTDQDGPERVEQDVEAQRAYDAQHDASDYHCLLDPCPWHPFEQRIRPTPRHAAALIEASSLGTPEAKAARESADPAHARLVVRLSEEMARAQAAEARAAAMEAAVLEAAVCDLYDAPQNCITAGPEVFAADGCTPCRIRAALSDSTALNDALARARQEAWDEALRWVRQIAGVTSPEYALDHIDRAEPFNPYRADALGAGEDRG